jgi:xylulose-5-phosphate/fructose-6-phosphate phosphoketolase
MSTLVENLAAEIPSLSPYGETRSTVAGKPLSAEELGKTDAYWRACNYLSLGMIYLLDNPFARGATRPDILRIGCWDTGDRGVGCFIVHLNGSSKYDGYDFLAGPGLARPAFSAPLIWKVL